MNTSLWIRRGDEVFDHRYCGLANYEMAGTALFYDSEIIPDLDEVIGPHCDDMRVNYPCLW